jgi:hypothetical protein
MNRLLLFLLILFLGLLRTPSLSAQGGTSFGPDLSQEVKGLSGCAHFSLQNINKCGTLFTGKPFHLAVGSLPPQNGIGIGLGFSEIQHPITCPPLIDFSPAVPPGTQNPCHWSLQYDADGQASTNGSWRIGAYVQAARIATRPRQMQIPGSTPIKIKTFTRPAPVVNFYYQTTSLNRIDYYGLGPDTLPSAQSSFGLTESIVGISANVPLPESPLDPLGISILGEANGRFPSIRGNHDSSSIASIETRYNETTAPGLQSQPSIAQFGEGIRFVPAFPYNRFRLNYLLNFQQFLNSPYGFRRLTADLSHQIPLYGTRTVQADTQPGASRSSLTTSSPVYVPLSAGGLPSASTTKDFTGSISFRMLLIESQAKAGKVVPFYFDPTIGGSDLNSNAMLPSYADYRFRAPNLVLLRGSFEQALGKLPLGVFFSIDAGKSALYRNDVDFTNLRKSYSVGLTVHAGGLPVAYLLFSWGGNEGNHFTGSISNALLGVSPRPSLF